MNQNLQPGTHLDADELSIFVDGKAKAHERERMLAHLGQCAECRRVVFLMQSPAEPEAIASVAGKKWTWRRWGLPIGLAGAALACSLAVAVYLSRQRGPGEIAGQRAQVQAPAASPVPGAKANNPGPPKETAKETSETPGRATSLNGATIQELRTGKPVEAQQTAAVPASVAATEKPHESLNAAAVSPGEAKNAEAGAEADAARPPAPVPQPQVAEGSAQGKDTTESHTFAAANKLPPLRIEHDRGPEDGMSEVAGRVTDASGAVVPGAQISLRDNTGTTRDATSGGDGTFRLAGVPPGHYELSVTARGFEMRREMMDLKPRDLAMLESVLTVGAATQTVTVESAAPLLQTQSASVSANKISPLPNHLPAAKTVALGKHALSLDEAGTLFVSRNGGRSWKKVKPQWAGKVAEIEAANSGAVENPGKRKKAGSSAEDAPSQFRLTTDSGAVWTSDDGTHWRAQ